MHRLQFPRATENSIGYFSVTQPIISGFNLNRRMIFLKLIRSASSLYGTCSCITTTVDDDGGCERLYGQLKREEKKVA